MMRTYVDAEKLINFLRTEYEISPGYRLISFTQGKDNWTARFTNGEMYLTQSGPLHNITVFLFEARK